MTPIQDHTHTTTRSDLASAWVLAGRDDEEAAWKRLYDAAHPRPVVDGGV